MTSFHAQTTIPFPYTTLFRSGNTGTQVTTTTDGSSVAFDKTNPAVTSINRQSPITETTNANSVVFRSAVHTSEIQSHIAVVCCLLIEEITGTVSSVSAIDGST